MFYVYANTLKNWAICFPLFFVLTIVFGIPALFFRVLSWIFDAAANGIEDIDRWVRAAVNADIDPQKTSQKIKEYTEQLFDNRPLPEEVFYQKESSQPHSSKRPKEVDEKTWSGILDGDPDA